MHYSTLISVSRRSTRESSSKSSSFALKAVYSGAIKANFSKTLGAVAVAICAKALEAAAVAICAGALKAAAVAAYAEALKAAAAAVTATVARVTRSCLGLLQPSGMLIMPNLRFSH